MQELKQIISHEQPRINETLAGYAAELQPSARVVAEHVLLSGGKRLRPLLTLLTGRALGCRDDNLYLLGAAVELLHTATLLHDDILDDADLRRGVPAAHTVFKPHQVILVGDAMLAKALFVVSSFGDSRLTRCISEAVLRTAEGEIAELAALRDPELAHQTYLEMITCKTAWMLRASCELGALYAGAGSEVCAAAAAFGLELGIAFQIVDDALDYAPTSATGKPSGGDLKEGKMTPPLLLYMDSLSRDEAAGFKQRFAENGFNVDELESVSRAVFEKGFSEKAREVAATHLARAAICLDCFPESGERAILRQILEYIKARTH